MKPVNFPESNKRIRHGSQQVHIYTDGKKCVSKWKLTLWETLKLWFTGCLWLTVESGGNQPPVSIRVDKIDIS